MAPVQVLDRAGNGTVLGVHDPRAGRLLERFVLVHAVAAGTTVTGAVAASATAAAAGSGRIYGSHQRNGENNHRNNHRCWQHGYFIRVVSTAAAARAASAATLLCKLIHHIFCTVLAFLLFLSFSGCETTLS